MKHSEPDSNIRPEKEVSGTDRMEQSRPSDGRKKPQPESSSPAPSPSPEKKTGSPFSRYVTSDSAGQGQKFMKNSRYFTICIYGLVMILVSAVIFKAIIDFNTTKAMFRQIFRILSPFVFGALLAYILNPMVQVFYQLLKKLADKARFRPNHTAHVVISILITYLLVFGFIVLVLLYVVPELMNNILDFANYIPHAYASLLNMLAELQERFPSVDIAGITKPLTDAIPDLMTTLRDMATNLVPAVYSFSMSVASWIVNLLIVIIVSIYMLYDKRQLMHTCWRVIYAFLPEKHVPACHEIMAECNHLFSSFVVGKFIDSTIIGLLCFLFMTILRLEYAPLISLIVGVTNMIPYFGPFIGAVPGVLILLFVKPFHAFAFAVLILCLQQFDGLILGPKILGESTGMKPLWIIFAITVGGSLAGVIGMFLGVPVVAILRYLFDSYLQYRLDKKKITDSRVDEVLGDMELDD